MIALLIMSTLSKIKHFNIYVEFFFTSLFLVSLAKEKSAKKAELQSYFKELDRSMWHNDLCNPDNISANIDRITNMYFLKKIKEAIKNNKKKVIEDDCSDFQNFIRVFIDTHPFCQPNCNGNRTGFDMCKIIENYTFLNSVSDTFLWMIQDLEQNPLLYKITENETRKQIEYKEMKGEFSQNELHILDDILTLKDDIKNLKVDEKEKKIQDFVQTKIEKKTQQEKTQLLSKQKILTEELKYVLLENYQPKDHPDFTKEIKIDRINNHSSRIRDFLGTSITHLKQPFFKLCLWTFILNFPT